MALLGQSAAPEPRCLLAQGLAAAAAEKHVDVSEPDPADVCEQVTCVVGLRTSKLQLLWRPLRVSRCSMLRVSCGCIKCIIHVRVQASRPTTSLGVTLPPKPCLLCTSSTRTSPPSPWTSAQQWPHPLSQLQVWWQLWGPAAVNAAVGLAVATLHNLAVRSHKATMLAFSIFTGWPLLPILDAQGNPPPASSCPETID